MFIAVKPRRRRAIRTDKASLRIAQLPVYVNVSRTVQPWRWTSVLWAPFELVALTASVPLAILLIMVPAGLAMAGALWLGHVILGRF